MKTNTVRVVMSSVLLVAGSAFLISQTGWLGFAGLACLVAAYIIDVERQREEMLQKTRDMEDDSE